MLGAQLVDNLEMISFYAFFVGWGWCEGEGCRWMRIVEDGRAVYRESWVRGIGLAALLGSGRVGKVGEVWGESGSGAVRNR